MQLVSWNVTDRCNLKCQHCYRDAVGEHGVSEELTTDQGLRLLDEMAVAGFRMVVFSGGEPLLRKDIFQLVGYAKATGMVPVMGTNGTLITPGVARQLKEAGLGAAAVSIDSLSVEKHDAFRGAAHALEQAITGAAYCKQAGLRVQINCTVTRSNLEELEEIMEFAQKLGAGSAHMLFLVEVGRGKNLSETALTREEYRAALHRILLKNARMPLMTKPTCAPQYIPEALYMGLAEQPGGRRGCIAGIAYASVLPNGDVHICPYAPVRVANVLEESFADIWYNNPIFLRLRNSSEYEGACGRCIHAGICGGCRARAYNNSGNWLGEDPYCLLPGRGE